MRPGTTALREWTLMKLVLNEVRDDFVHFTSVAYRWADAALCRDIDTLEKDNG